MRRIIYLAGPYTHPDPFVRENRYRALTEAAAKLIMDGHIVFSPITHLHPIDAFLRPETRDTDWWFTVDEPFMRSCTELVVLCLDGWRDSRGTAAEIAWFEARGLPVSFAAQGMARDSAETEGLRGLSPAKPSREAMRP